MLFFTRDNRDPKLYTDPDKMPTKVTLLQQNYNLWQITLKSFAGTEEDKNYVLVNINGGTPAKYQVIMHYRNAMANIKDINISSTFVPAHGLWNPLITPQEHPPEWSIKSFICDFPYVFVTYQQTITGEHSSGIYHNLPDTSECNEYNPFEYTGRQSNVEYLQAKWNDKTGLGVIINDWNDLYINEAGVEAPRVKELGWTPDTLLVYPGPEMYRLLVARLADKFASLNESQVMAIQKELTEAEFAFKGFLGKDKSAWQRIDNVNGPSIGDWL
jgi:hypothetical protein